jgi:hypothetical protein
VSASASSDSALRVVVTGFIGQHPLGGVTWDYLQYVLGLHLLGHDVYYLEDTGEWPYNPGGTAGADWVVADCSQNVQHLGEVMARFGLGDRWAFRCPIGPEWAGLPERRREDVLASADLLINVSGSLAYPQRYRAVERLAYIDSDPVFTQIKLAQGLRRFSERVELHDVYFSFGERLGEEVPATGHRWFPTRQPIVLAEWRPATPQRERFTTVMNWASYDALSYDGQTYGQKNVEFERFLELPSLVAPTELEIAVRRTRRRKRPSAPVERLERKGWRIVDPNEVCAGLDGYRHYVETSRGEWSVAKNGYVIGKPGWFSCRSACYLAAGRPVVVEDTGFADVLPVGEGLLTFQTTDGAAAAIRAVESDYDRHSAAARAIAEQYFDSDRVLTRLLEEALA